VLMMGAASIAPTLYCVTSPLCHGRNPDHALCHCAGGWRGSLRVRSQRACPSSSIQCCCAVESRSVGMPEPLCGAKAVVEVCFDTRNSELSCEWRSVDLHTLGEDEATQTPQQRQAAELIDACKEVFAFSGAACSPRAWTQCASSSPNRQCQGQLNPSETPLKSL